MTRTEEDAMTKTSATWIGHGTERGDAAPETYERYLVPALGRPFATDLVSAAEIRPGERVLDVACGTGIVARLAAERVGPTGTVAGLDVNAGMLAVARTAAAHGAAIRWYETAAESMPLPDESFDVVLCQLGLQFMADRAAALGEMRRVSAPGGRILVNVAVPNPFFDVLDRALAHHVGDAAAGFVRAVFSLDDPDHVDRLFRGADLREVEVRTETRALHLPPAGEFLWQYVFSTPLAGVAAGLEDEVLSALERDVVEGWQPWSADGGIAVDQSVMVATGRR
jgi:SAM-dependent methyltransferase